MRNNVRENVQEHSHMVAVIAFALAAIDRDIFSGNACPDEVAAAALFHDASEIMTGDMPTPVKYFNSDIVAAYKDIEDAASKKLLSTLPKELKPAFEKAMIVDRSSKTHQIVKAADKIAAYIKCVEELNAGNGEFRLAAEQTKNKIFAFGLPEVEYFMENFIPAFDLTLDELDLSID
jgi:5'-deoxynucleotidase